jgi:hypothetical protein
LRGLEFGSAHGLECAFDFFKRGGVSEAEAALALGTEDDARDGGDVSAVEQEVGGFAAVFVEVAAAGEGVEGAFGHGTFKAKSDESGDEEVATLAVIVEAMAAEVVGDIERGEGGVLRGSGDAVGGVENDLAHAGHEGLGGNDVSHTPAGHAVAFGKSVGGESAFEHAGKTGDGEVVAVVDEVFVGFVGDDEEIAFAGKSCDLFGLGAREDGAGGILRRVVVDGAGGGSGEGFQRLADSVAARRGGGDEERASFGAGDEIADGGPVRREDEDVVAGIEHGLEGSVEGVGSAGGDKDLIFSGDDGIAASEFVNESGAQRADAGAGSVARVIVVQSLRHGELDGLRRVEERLAAVESPDALAGLPEGHDFVADLDDIGEADFVEPSSELGGCACHEEPFYGRRKRFSLLEGRG